MDGLERVKRPWRVHDMPSARPQTKIDTLIGLGTCVEGDVSFSGNLRIDGTIHGKVVGIGDIDSVLTISEHGAVEGEVDASFVVLNGRVTGAVTGSKHIELQAKARICGDVRYRSIEIQLGAIVEGRLIHEGVVDLPATSAKVVALKSSSGVTPENDVTSEQTAQLDRSNEE